MQPRITRPYARPSSPPLVRTGARRNAVPGLSWAFPIALVLWGAIGLVVWAHWS